MNRLISLNLRLHNRDSSVHLVAVLGNAVTKSSRAGQWEDDSPSPPQTPHYYSGTVAGVSAPVTVTNVYGCCCPSWGC